MKKLEDKVLKKVYSYESRQTLLKLIFRLVAFLSFTLGVIMMLGLIIDSFAQHKTLAIFEIFFEDFEVIRENIGEVINTFFYEAPTFEILVVFTIVIILIVLIIKLVLNFTRIKNKLIWLIKFFLGR